MLSRPAQMRPPGRPLAGGYTIQTRQAWPAGLDWVDDRERNPRVCRHLVASRVPRTARKRNRGPGGVLLRTNMGVDRFNFGV